jgi:glycosyltransferase involved in cell wall biosynthesis
MPRVTVIVPNYNHARFLAKRLQSILNQTYQDFELVYLDDASTDNSNDVFAQFAGDKRVCAHYNQINSGSPFKQWNRGVRMARGEYVWIAEADDDADPRLLAELVKRLDEHPAVGLAYCQSWMVDENGMVLGTVAKATADLDRDRWQKDFVANGREECRRYLAFRNTIPNASAVAFRRSVYERAGYAPEHLRLCGDWLAWVRMALVSDVAFVAEPLNYFRKHRGSVRHKSARGGVFAEESYQVVRFLFERLAPSDELVEKVSEVLFGTWAYYCMCTPPGMFSWNCQRRILHAARRVDPRALRRLWWLTEMYLERNAPLSAFLLSLGRRALGRSGASRISSGRIFRSQLAKVQ